MNCEISLREKLIQNLQPNSVTTADNIIYIKYIQKEKPHIQISKRLDDFLIMWIKHFIFCWKAKTVVVQFDYNS
jgi:hypothetical protein